MNGQIGSEAENLLTDEIRSAADLLTREILHRATPEGVALREMMIAATMKVRAPSLTAALRWRIVNASLEAIRTEESTVLAGPEDRDDDLTGAIAASARSPGYWGTYPVALAAVSNRYSKSALTHLVAHLIMERDAARAQAAQADAARDQAIQEIGQAMMALMSTSKAEVDRLHKAMAKIAEGDPEVLASGPQNYAEQIVGRATSRR